MEREREARDEASFIFSRVKGGVRPGVKKSSRDTDPGNLLGRPLRAKGDAGWEKKISLRL